MTNDDGQNEKQIKRGGGAGGGLIVCLKSCCLFVFQSYWLESQWVLSSSFRLLQIKLGVQGWSVLSSRAPACFRTAFPAERYVCWGHVALLSALNSLHSCRKCLSHWTLTPVRLHVVEVDHVVIRCQLISWHHAVSMLIVRWQRHCKILIMYLLK